ncbi:efflux RND transporter permease subunit [Microbacterium sp. MPKO10]|uniref:efflux RND transporter permease subunit n=1 Tax=Microbacterium sp. MPKO10 TaxID=2989818 RepID=UPI0022367802|nr:efflux RND transporter permease subunit [Microbacterium sp. MPKO10]MCW4458923.1 efflux RND transporter permease subunit [Microbacterium sp. MPKO10]
MHLLSVASLKNRALIALVTIVVAVFGVISLTGLKQELAPNITFPQLAIVTNYPGASPNVVNDDVSTPVEKAISGVPGLESTSATSSTNLSLVSATFTYGTDLNTAEQKINQAIERISSTLPEDVDPQVMTGSLDDLPIIQLAVTGGDNESLNDLLERVAVPTLEDVEGVREAAIVGAAGQRVTITPDVDELAASGATTQNIQDALQQNGNLVGAGEITEDGSTYSVQSGTKLESVDDLTALPLTGVVSPEGDQVTVGDVASVELTENPQTTRSRVNGEEALTLSITKLPDANTVDVSHGVTDALPELEDALGSDVTLTVVFDQAPYIEQSIESLSTEGLLGLVFAVLVILLFLLDVRATLVTAISIPTSVLITFIGLQVSDYTLNILTLGALTIAIGRVVDDSIVVIENIKRHLGLSSDRSGGGRLQSIGTAVREVAGAITASTITTVAVFLPLALVGDMTGELFRPFALTVTIALLASLLVSLTIVPVLAYWFLRALSEKQQAKIDARQQKQAEAVEAKDRARAEAEAARVAKREAKAAAKSKRRGGTATSATPDAATAPAEPDAATAASASDAAQTADQQNLTATPAEPDASATAPESGVSSTSDGQGVSAAAAEADAAVTASDASSRPATETQPASTSQPTAAADSEGAANSEDAVAPEGAADSEAADKPSIAAMPPIVSASYIRTAKSPAASSESAEAADAATTGAAEHPAPAGQPSPTDQIRSVEQTTSADAGDQTAAAEDEPAGSPVDGEPTASPESDSPSDSPEADEPETVVPESVAPETAEPAGVASTASGLSRRSRRRAQTDHEDELKHPTLLQRSYLPIIRWTLKHSATTIILSLLVMGVTLAAAPFMKTNFLGDSGQNTLSVTQTLDPGTSLDAQDKAAQKVEDTLLDIDGIETVQVSIGSSGSSLSDAFLGGGEGAITFSITTDVDADQTALQQTVRDKLSMIDDAGTIEVAASSGFGASTDIEVDITATSADDLQKATDAVHDAVSGLDAVAEVSDNLAETRPFIEVAVDRQDAAEAGYSEIALSSYVSSATQPQQAGTIVIDGSTLTIYMEAGDEPTTIDELKDLEIPTPTGMVALSTLATVEITDGPQSVTTVGGDRSATVSATPAGDNIGGASAEVLEALDTVDLPSGATAEIGGVSADQDTAFQQLGIAMLAAILIVYIVMVATFRSLRQPLLLLVSVPFAATGAIGLQLATGVPLGVPSLIGVLMLIGIVVTNAIVLVDLVNQYRDKGLSVADAVEHGAVRRLRPILMTALATIFALTPMALGITGHGGFISQPLAIVVIGGLVSSTVLTLVVLPTLYNLVEGAKERRAAKRARKDADKAKRAEADASPTEAETAGVR